MKIRTNFVSNSSSSSFVVIVTKEAHDRAVAAISDQHGVLKQIFRGIKPLKKFGTEVMVISGRSNEDSNVIGSARYEGMPDDYDSWEEIDRMWYVYLSQLQPSEFIEREENY